jgi:hypothetical protein
MCRELAEVFRESTSRGKIIEVIPSPLDPAKNHPDAIVVSKDESSKLVRTIRESLRESRSKNDEKWMELCSQAAVERDPNKLMKLLEELDRVLDEREKRRTLPSSSGDEQ